MGVDRATEDGDEVTGANYPCDWDDRRVLHALASGELDVEHAEILVERCIVRQRCIEVNISEGMRIGADLGWEAEEQADSSRSKAYTQCVSVRLRTS